MDIRLSVFPTSNYYKLIAYTTNYKIRNSIANQFRVLIDNYSMTSDSLCPYQIVIGVQIRYLPYDVGRAIEKILDYISHREEKRIYEDDRC